MNITQIDSYRVPPLVTQEQVYYLQKQDNHIKALVCLVKFQSFPRDLALQQYVTKLHHITKIKRGVVYIHLANAEDLIMAPDSL